MAARNVIQQFWFLIQSTQQYDNLLVTAFNIGGRGTVFGRAAWYGSWYSNWVQYWV
jgi:hypothetical protein